MNSNLSRTALLWGKPKLVISVSREYGSGGFEIALTLVENLV